MGHRGTAAALVATVGALVAPTAVAQAAPVAVTNPVAQPIAYNGTCAAGGASAPDAPAGAHRDFCLAFDLGTTSDDVHKIVISLPAGVVGDPTATPRCAQATFTAGGCTAAQQVGTVSSDVVASEILPLTLTGEVYNLVPSAGEPARLGIALDQGLAGGLSPTYLQAPIRVRVPDAGLDSVTDNIPNNAGVSLHVRSMALTMWGTQVHHPSMAKPFIALPTRCDIDAPTTFTVTSYGGQTTTASAKFRPDHCQDVPFTPGLEVGPATTAADTPGEAWAKLLVPGTDTGTGDGARRQAYLKDVALKLPAGLALNPPLANGLLPCTPEQFGATLDATPKCAANTVMGTVEFQTPIFPGDTLTGKVYFGTPLPFAPLVNFISVEDPRLRVKLTGYATIDPLTTAITAHFTDQPQVPFTSFKFTYIDPGDGRATLTSPVNCGNYPVTAQMTPWSGGADVSPTKTFAVDNCPPEGFAPKVAASESTTQAGADTALTIHLERPDKQQRLKSMTVSLPPGLTGRLPVVPQCAVADARMARCPAASQVGTARVTVGTGPAPLPVPGKVYLTQGFDGGIAGLAVIVDTKQPAIDLGLVTVMNKIVVRPDTGLDIVSDPLPQALQGIPTVYRSIDITVDKPGFMLNATSCADQAVHASFASVGGAGAVADAPYKATGCDKLPFAPTITASLGAPKENAVRGHPPLTVTIEQPDGQAAMAKTVVSLPVGMGVDLLNLRTLCTEAQFNGQACPAGSQIGSVSAVTPLLPQTLVGGAYLVQGAKPGALPRLGLDLGLTRLLGDVAIGQRLVTSFNSVPDVPLRKLVLTLNGGPKAALQTSLDLCTATTAPSLVAQFVSQSGVTKNATINPTLVGCNPINGSGRLTGAAKRRPTPSLKLKVVSSQPLKELRIKLPAQLHVVSKRVKRARLLLGGRPTRGTKVRYAKGYLTFRAGPGTVFRAPQITVPRTMLKQTRRLKAGSTATVRAVGISTKRKVLRGSIPVTVVG